MYQSTVKNTIGGLCLCSGRSRSSKTQLLQYLESTSHHGITTLPKFLNTNAINYFLEELIKNATERLVLISPFLKLNDRIKELLEDKNRLKIDVRIIYGKNELQPEEIN